MPAVAMLADACLALARGEILQRQQAGDPSVTVDATCERCTLKTGRLFSAAALLGARFSRLPQTMRRALGRFAEALGPGLPDRRRRARLRRRPDTTGKPLGTDLLDGTVTLPLILAAARDPQVAAVIARGAGPDDVLPTLARVVASGAVADARAEAQRLAERAHGRAGRRHGAGRHGRAARGGAAGRPIAARRPHVAPSRPLRWPGTGQKAVTPRTSGRRPWLRA